MSHGALWRICLCGLCRALRAGFFGCRLCVPVNDRAYCGLSKDGCSSTANQDGAKLHCAEQEKTAAEGTAKPPRHRGQ